MERLALMIYHTNLIFDQIKNEQNRHLAYHHAQLTLKAAKAILKQENLDNDCILIAAYMHDCANYQPVFDHAHKGADIAYELLKKTNCFSEEECLFIHQMIWHHSDKDHIHSKADEIIKNADVLAKYWNQEELSAEKIKRIASYQFIQ